MKTHALVATCKGVVELLEIDVADPQPGEVQVRVAVTLISPGTERAFLLGLENTTAVFPQQLGYSAAGYVEKIGSNVTRFREGDRVACFCLSHCSLGNVCQSFCMPIPDETPFDQAAFLALGVICLQGVRKARIEIGESAMILGLGPIGQLAVQFCVTSGAIPVIGVDRATNRLEMAKRNRADVVIDNRMDGWLEALNRETDGMGPHVVIESTGIPDAVNTAFECVRKFGRVSLLGCPRGLTTVNFYSTVHRKALTVVGAHIMGYPEHDSRPGFWTWQDDAGTFLKLLKSNRIDVRPLVTDRCSYRDAISIYERLISWNTDMMVPAIDWM